MFLNSVLLTQVSNPVLSGGLGRGWDYINTIIPRVLNIVYIIAVVVFVIVFIIGAFQWITAGGDKSKLAEARGKITHAIIGLLILLSIFVISRLVYLILGVDIANFGTAGSGGPAPTSVVVGYRSCTDNCTGSTVGYCIPAGTPYPYVGCGDSNTNCTDPTADCICCPVAPSPVVYRDCSVLCTTRIATTGTPLPSGTPLTQGYCVGAPGVNSQPPYPGCQNFNGDCTGPTQDCWCCPQVTPTLVPSLIPTPTMVPNFCSCMGPSWCPGRLTQAACVSIIPLPGCAWVCTYVTPTTPPVGGLDLPTSTPTLVVPTSTNTPIPTRILLPPVTATPTPTRIPTQTPTTIPTSTPTRIPTPTPTRVPTSTPLPTNTPVPTATPFPTPTIAAFCTDTDGGINYSTYGFVSSMSSLGVFSSVSDRCSSSVLLNENYCVSTSPMSQTYDCRNISSLPDVTYGCDAGRCCRLSGSGCSTSNDCCGGNICNNGRCQAAENILLNEATGISCRDLCWLNGFRNGDFCQSIGTNSTADNGMTYVDMCSLTNVHGCYSGILASIASPLCNGHATNWTYCNCVPNPISAACNGGYGCTTNQECDYMGGEECLFDSVVGTTCCQ